jgi:copper transport protein
VFDGTAADVVLGSSAHLGAGQRLIGLVLLAYAATRRTDGASAAALLGLAGVAIALTSFFVAGHTATREPRAVGWTIDLVHTTTASIWVGGLLGLAVVLRHRRPDDASGAAVVLRRFSLAASGSVALLLASGLGLAWAELAPAGGVPFNGYGLVLLAKAGIALAALAIGALNHFVVVPAVESGEQDAWSTLANTLRVELGAVVALVALTGVLTGLAP